MPSNNVFKNLNIDRNLIQPAVEEIGGEGYSYNRVGNTFHLACSLGGTPFRMAVYENKDGSTTLSYLAPADRGAFEKLATHIAANCTVGDGGQFEFSTRKFPKEHVDLLLEYLQEEGAVIVVQREENGYRITKLRSKQGDVLTVKAYENGTLQLQGRRAMIAAHAQSYLTDVLPLADAVKAQMETFAVPVDLQVVEDETAGRLPHAYDRLGLAVAAQLTSAIALTKVSLELPDYGAVAFPALRGLEGFIKDELRHAGFDVLRVNNFGEYFKESVIVGKYEMRPDAATTIGEPRASSLAECYTLYARERHGIVHMNWAPETSRMLGSLDEAKRIVFSVLNTIEQFCRRLQ